ncbi:hypothetical protein Vadar_023528 [Vaccinium darrowii]|uniref:Uncharacterized protein n=1 Tax=Vaccinium darrowii TaxID=229202 RepID=A0ACB7Y220_9ERIC|nr:hypothetical protein Vadar_023528 [Vaccinium darrowii]
MQPLVKTPLHHQQRVPPEQGLDRTGIARLEQLPFVHEYEPVRLWIGREHRRLTEDVRREYRSKPGDPVVNEGLWVGCFVCGDKVEGLAEEGEAKGARREAEVAVEGGEAAEEEEGEEGERGCQEEEVVERERDGEVVHASRFLFSQVLTDNLQKNAH